MSYTLDLIIVSIGIIGWFQLVSILTFFVYSYMFNLCSMISQILVLIKLDFFNAHHILTD